MARAFQSPVLAIFGLSLVLSLGLGGCASGGMLEQLPPALGGEPASLPAKPKTDYQYPAVHDMPPDRASVPMTDEEQLRLERDLANQRDRQEGRPPPGKKPPLTAKKPPKDADNGQNTGAKANP
jgi:hypothetical protein